MSTTDSAFIGVAPAVLAYLGAYFGAFNSAAVVGPPAVLTAGHIAAECVCACGVPWTALASAYVAGAVSAALVLCSLWCQSRWSFGGASEGGVSVGPAVVAVALPRPAPSAALSDVSVAGSSLSSLASGGSGGGADALAVWAPRRRTRQL